MNTVSEIPLQYRKDTTPQGEGSTKIGGKEDPLICNIGLSTAHRQKTVKEQGCAVQEFQKEKQPMEKACLLVLYRNCSLFWLLHCAHKFT